MNDTRRCLPGGTRGPRGKPRPAAGRARGSYPAAGSLAFVGLGGNQGERRAHLSSGLAALAVHREIQVIRVSSVYQTAPVGGPCQPDFLNAVVLLATGLAPAALLRVMQGIEARHRRQRAIRWGPRTLDLDLLLMGHLRRCSGELILPHPRMTRRAFVLVPLCELAPDLRHPGTGLLMRQHLLRLDYSGGIKRLTSFTLNSHRDQQP